MLLPNGNFPILMNGIITVKLMVVKNGKDEGKPLITNHSQKFEIFLKIVFETFLKKSA